MSNLRALLHHETLLATYDQGAMGVQTPLFERFYTNPTNIDTDDASLLVRPATRKAAPLNRRHVAAHQLALQGKTKMQGALFHVFNKFRLSAEVFQGLREPESESVQRKARREIADQMEHFDRMHAIQKELLTAKLLVNGAVAMDSSGNIIESAGADDELFTFGISANHQGAANGLAQPFDDPATDIEEMFEDIKQQARSENAPPPELAICNSTIKPYIRANTLFQKFAAATPSGERVIYGELVEGLFGMDWMFVDHVYEDASGTVRKFIPDEKLILVPKSNDWIQAVQGLELVPTKLDINGADAETLANSLAEVYGKFAYAKCEHDPVGLDVYVGDNYGYIVREPNAIWQLDVIFS